MSQSRRTIIDDLVTLCTATNSGQRVGSMGLEQFHARANGSVGSCDIRYGDLDLRGHTKVVGPGLKGSCSAVTGPSEFSTRDCGHVLRYKSKLF